MADDVASGAAPTLDSLAPSAPAPVAAPAPPAAAPAAPAPAAAPSAPDFSPLLKSLGYENTDALQRDLQFTRQFREDVARQRAERERNDPANQQRAERAEAFRQLMRETYGEDVARQLSALPDLGRERDQQINDQAWREATAELAKIGVVDDGSPEAKKELQEWDDAITGYLMAPTERSLAWNKRWFEGGPAERSAVLKEIITVEEGRMNRSLLRQNAQTLRDAAARRSSAASPRSVPLPQVRQEPITATDPFERRKQSAAATSRTLDDIHAHFLR